MESIGKLKDSFKNFETKFQSFIFNKREFVRSANVENDFIRIYDLNLNKNSGQSIGFAVNNTNVKLDDNGFMDKNKIIFYKNLFKQVMNLSEYKTIEEFYTKDKELLIKTCLDVESKNKPNYYVFKESNLEKMVKLASIREIITVSLKDNKDNIYSKNYEFEDFKEQFKKFIKNEDTIDAKGFIKIFQLKINDRDIIKTNINDKFISDNKKFLSEYVDIKDKKEVAIKEFKDCNKEYEKLMKEYSNKIKKELGYDKFYETQQNLISATTDLDRKLYGSLYNQTNIVQDYYYDNQDLNSNIGFNIFKSDITKRINDLSKDDFIEKSILEENLDFMRGR